jgi:capsular polysaccharide transport system permease protein
VSEAHYLVRAQGGTQTSGGGLAALLGGGGGGGLGGATGGGGAEANSVSDYLTSHDVVEVLNRRLNLVAIFRRPEADLLSRLWEETPTPETLLRFYQRQVDIYFDADTGITDLKVRTFRPADSYAIARTLLALGEQRVNEMNERSYRDAVQLADRQLNEARANLTQVQAQLTGFRQREQDVDPTNSANAQIQLNAELRGNLATLSAQRATTAATIGTNNPQFQALDRQVRSLQGQLAQQEGRLTGGAGAIASGLGNYEQLRIQQGLLAKQYDAAAAAYETARQQAVRQQLYIVRVVDANMPVKSLYPKRAITLLTMFIVLTVLFGIGWLIAAGVREHAA